METKYKTIYIARYNNGERNFKEEKTVFNEFEINEIVGEEATKKIFILLCDSLKKDNDYFEYDENTYPFDITRIYVDLDKVDFLLYNLNRQLFQHAVTVSGDDDAYDYFPDLLRAFLQICEALDKLDYYNNLVPALNRVLDLQEDDELYIHKEMRT